MTYNASASSSLSNITYRIFSFDPDAKVFVSAGGNFILSSSLIYFDTFSNSPNARGMIMAKDDGVFLITPEGNASVSMTKILDYDFKDYSAQGMSSYIFCYSQSKKVCRVLCVQSLAEATVTNSIPYSWNTSAAPVIVFPGTSPVLVYSNSIQAYIYDPANDELGSSSILKSSEAIVLKNANKGAPVNVVFSGTVEMESVSKGAIIESAGVYGEAPLSKILNVYAKGRPDLCVRGAYTGTGTFGADNPVEIELGFTPKMVVISSTGNSTVSAQAESLIAISPSNVGIYYTAPYSTSVSSGSIRGNSVKVLWTPTGLKFYGGTADIQMNTLGQAYQYVAFK